MVGVLGLVDHVAATSFSLFWMESLDLWSVVQSFLVVIHCLAGSNFLTALACSASCPRV